MVSLAMLPSSGESDDEEDSGRVVGCGLGARVSKDCIEQKQDSSLNKKIRKRKRGSNDGSGESEDWESGTDVSYESDEADDKRDDDCGEADEGSSSGPESEPDHPNTVLDTMVIPPLESSTQSLQTNSGLSLGSYIDKTLSNPIFFRMNLACKWKSMQDMRVYMSSKTTPESEKIRCLIDTLIENCSRLHARNDNLEDHIISLNRSVGSHQAHSIEEIARTLVQVDSLRSSLLNFHERDKEHANKLVCHNSCLRLF